MFLRRSLCIAALLSGATACSADANEPVLATTNPLLEQIRPNVSAEEFIAVVLRPFDQLAGESGAITAKALEDRDNKRRAEIRANAVRDVLRYDLNGDLKVTNGEVINALTIEQPRYNASPQRYDNMPAAQFNAMKRTLNTSDRVARFEKTARDRADRLFLQYDMNKDGSIDVAEAASASAESDERRLVGRRDDMVRALMPSSLGKDGVLTRTELKTFGERTFRAVDKNGDGRISAEEYVIVREALNK
jgi:Ca2+-binding EF-hand superfamily protein